MAKTNGRTKGGGTRKHKSGEAGPSVLGSLPSTRTSRIGGRRDAKPATGEGRRATAERKVASARPAAPKPRARRPASARKPTPVRAGAPSLRRPAGAAAPPPARPPRSGPPSGAELVTTAVQAAGELAQIGLTVGGQILKRAVDRLPKP
jgi:hypothetical protein